MHIPKWNLLKQFELQLKSIYGSELKFHIQLCVCERERERERAVWLAPTKVRHPRMRDTDFCSLLDSIRNSSTIVYHGWFKAKIFKILTFEERNVSNKEEEEKKLNIFQDGLDEELSHRRSKVYGGGNKVTHVDCVNTWENAIMAISCGFPTDHFLGFAVPHR